MNIARLWFAYLFIFYSSFFIATQSFSAESINKTENTLDDRGRNIWTDSEGITHVEIKQPGNDTNENSYIPTSSPGRAIVSSPGAETTSSEKIIYTGPRGGKYYINRNGNKTYIKKR